MSLDPIAASSLLQRYAKQHAAGAFATPTTRELAANPDRIIGDESFCAVKRQLARDSIRKDWTGRRFVIPRNSTVITHLARQDDVTPPDWIHDADYVMAYAEDRVVAQSLDRSHDRIATRITAASEVIAVYGPQGNAWTETPVDLVTLGSVPDWTVAPEEQAALLDELADVSEWADDFPFYSDGTWDAVSLRGYDPTDPSWGVKPIEMGKKWHQANPGAINRQCEWTTLAARCPVSVAIAERVANGAELERVRYLRMRARADGKPSTLRRHSDVTDPSCGTRLGQMIRLFVPLVTDPSVAVTSWTLDGATITTHLEPWRLHYLDARKPHAVVNPSPIDRVHLTIDVIVNHSTQQLITTVA